MLAIKDFLTIPNIDNVYQIKPLKEWCKKHNSTYNKIYDVVWKSNLYDPNNDILRLSNINIKNQDEVFINLYNEINKIVKYHQTENDFIIRMNDYKKAINSKNKLGEWFIKNEGINFSSCYDNFLIDYLDYSDNPKHLILNVEIQNGNNLFIDRRCFKSTIELLELITIFETAQEEKMRNVVLPSNNYPISTIKEQLIKSCKEGDPKLFYPYLQLKNVLVNNGKANFYNYFKMKIYDMKFDAIGNLRLEITNDTDLDGNEVKAYQFYDEAHKYSLLLLYIKETKDSFTFVDIAPF